MQIWEPRPKSLLEKHYPNSELRRQRPPRIFQIKDIVVGFSESGEVITIPRSHDAFNIGVCGEKRGGKTLVLHAIVDRLVNHWKVKCAILNDAHYETTYWNKPNRVSWMINRLNLLFEKPRPLPMVFVYPSTNTLKIREEYRPYVKISIPWEDFVENPFYFFDAKDIVATAAHYIKVKQDLLTQKDKYSVISFLDGKKGDGVDQIPGGSVNRVVSFFGKAFNDQILDFNSDACSSILLRKNKKVLLLSPLVALMSVNVIPSLITTDLQSKDYFEQIFSYHMEKIIDAQIEGIFGKDEEVYVAIDEFNRIQEKAREILIRSVAEGAHFRLGLIWSGQNYSKIEEKIRSNTKYIISLRQKATDAKAIGDDYGLSTSEKERLIALDKENFEAAFLTHEKFRLYDPLNNKITDSEGPIFGYIAYPLSAHKPPRELTETETIQITQTQF